MRTAFITGCRTGFGKHLAIALLESGYQVIATDPDEVALKAALPTHKHLITYALELRNTAQINEVANQCLIKHPIHLLVNNAGYGLFGTVEHTDIDLVQEMFEVNLWGGVRLTQHFLPQLRANQGTIVQLSSVAGRTVFPESGFYAATKYAIEAMSEALYQETCTFGVRLRLIEPGCYDTCFASNAQEMSPSRKGSSDYQAIYPQWDARKQEVLEAPQPPEEVVQAILDSLDNTQPFLRIPVGRDSQRILKLRDTLGPDAWSLFAAQRVGSEYASTVKGQVLQPEQVLSIDPNQAQEFSESLLATQEAQTTQHLEHWALTTTGTNALCHLKTLIQHIEEK
jgi:short-subunit dehydrogenase